MDDERLVSHLVRMWPLYASIESMRGLLKADDLFHILDGDARNLLENALKKVTQAYHEYLCGLAVIQPAH